MTQTLLVLLLAASTALAVEKPNVILFFADDISARELPVYGSSVWSPPERGNTSDPAFRAKTPVLDQLAHDGCWIKTAWAATCCKPSRAMIMTGRYAHLQKWWNNADIGKFYDKQKKLHYWPVYESSSPLLAEVAGQAGYGTFWGGKIHLGGDYGRYGFDECCFTPGVNEENDNPYTDFKLDYTQIDGKRVLINSDTGSPVKTYGQHGWYWYPHVRLVNPPTAPGQTVWWPNTAASQKNFGLNTFGPDIIQDFAFDFMERKQKEGKPFFIYHASHLGHDAFNWFNPEAKSSWPQTPIVTWDGKKYTRTEPYITGDNGVYDTHGTVSTLGIHNHINYIDYQIWRYQQKLREMGIADNTILIFTTDNGTGGYGKNSGKQQQGCHVPMIIYAPGMTKHGEQDVLVSLADMLPTLAELTGFNLPDDYEINGKSLVPFLYSNQKEHREWIYSYRGPEQIIRGKKVLRDGEGKWWDITENPLDLTSYSEVTDWGAVSEAHREEREKLLDILPSFDRYDIEHEAPGVPLQPTRNKGKKYHRE